MDAIKLTTVILNADKMEVIWCATGRRQHQLPTDVLPVAGVPVHTVSSVSNLGIYIDFDLIMLTHVGYSELCRAAAVAWLH